MKTFDIREELEKYIAYLLKIKMQEYPVPASGDVNALQFRNGANAEKIKQIDEVVKSLQAILNKTKWVYY